MNLHSLVSGAISAVNPMQNIVVFVSTGYTQADNHSQVPSYADPVNVPSQIQPMSWKDLRQTESLNLQGTPQAIYVNGKIDGLVRVDRKGGDLIVTRDGRWWLVEQVLEQWATGWCKVAVTLQNGS